MFGASRNTYRVPVRYELRPDLSPAVEEEELPLALSSRKVAKLRTLSLVGRNLHLLSQISIQFARGDDAVASVRKAVRGSAEPGEDAFEEYASWPDPEIAPCSLLGGSSCNGVRSWGLMQITAAECSG